MEGIRGIVPIASLLAFAVLYFGVMGDAGLFDPVIRALIRLVGTDPMKIVIGTAAIAAIAHLDGAGASTFMITVPAMLPIYTRLRMDPLALTCTTALAAGTMNILPWGGPTTRPRRASRDHQRRVPARAAGDAGRSHRRLRLATLIGRKERRRLTGVSLADVNEAAAHPAAARITRCRRPALVRERVADS
jgi:CitMHS family citrate-Mg2+:H+ or citrate-Ca2+:H+ symporter